MVRSDPKFIFVLQKDRELKLKDLFMMASALFALSAFKAYVYNSFLVWLIVVLNEANDVIRT